MTKVGVWYCQFSGVLREGLSEIHRTDESLLRGKEVGKDSISWEITRIEEQIWN